MPESAEQSPGTRRSELIRLLVAWLLIAAVVVLFAKQNLSVPGLYYDEAVFAGLAKDFVTGQVHGQHMPDHETVTFAGRPFPLFVQTYLGALKSWMLIPAFRIFGSTFAVLRGSNLFWQLVAVLLLMLGARRFSSRLGSCRSGISLDVFLLPDAIRVHHATLVYPLPHLILAALIVMFWKTRTERPKLDYAISALIVVVLVDLVAGGIHGIDRTERLIQETGGRGRWSESLNQFAATFPTDPR
jgi:hypothetical protein